MGKEKAATTQVTNQTTTPTPTAEETALNQRNLRVALSTESGETAMQNNALSLGNQLLTSFGSPDSSMWQSLIGGVNQSQQNSMINETWRMLDPSLQAQGISDSGIAASVKMRSATDLMNQNAQFNVGAIQNALNLALTGQAQIQQPVLGVTSQLGSQLAGLRSVSSVGTSNQTNSSMNPFLKSFQTSLGQGLGSVPGNILSRLGQGTGMYGGGSV